MDSIAHAACGAAVAGGGLTLVQSLLAQRLLRPSGFALSVGGFVGTFRLIESLGRKLEDDAAAVSLPAVGKPQLSRVPSVAAGLAAIVAVYFLEARRKGLLISYAALEAALLLVKEYTTLAEIKHIEIPMGVLATHRIIYTWFYGAGQLTKSQLATLDGLTRVPKDVLSRARAELPVCPDVSRCDIFHHGRTCNQFLTDFFKTHIKEAMKLYIPIYFFSAVLTKYEKWIWGPRPSVTGLVAQYVRTCGCLAMSFVIPIGASCLLPIKHHRTTVVLAGMLSALALAIEHEKRRITVIKSIALYPIAATASQIGMSLELSKRSISLWQYFIFSVSMAVLFKRPEKQNARVMRLLFGHKVVRSSPIHKKSEMRVADGEEKASHV